MPLSPTQQAAKRQSRKRRASQVSLKVSKKTTSGPSPSYSLIDRLNEAEIMDGNTKLMAAKPDLLDTTKDKLSKDIAKLKEQAENGKLADTEEPVDKNGDPEEKSIKEPEKQKTSPSAKLLHPEKVMPVQLLGSTKDACNEADNTEDLDDSADFVESDDTSEVDNDVDIDKDDNSESGHDDPVVTDDYADPREKAKARTLRNVQAFLDNTKDKHYIDIRLDQLTGRTNFNNWNVGMELLLRMHQVWCVVDDYAPLDESHELYPWYDHMVTVAISLIYANVSPEIRAQRCFRQLLMERCPDDMMIHLWVHYGRPESQDSEEPE
ncbi:uncharacterized protein N7482_010479 [Penicillium canariense]|uniref:Uncharacterized protein n=1 Tax=Penicillium canariense TaxID=189055 RepID=A0A9W9HN20_9EURO|nr:uncharacterized protein N7482_010479 [Penicillium canariense]KAJ5151227.1 hypothetical protein N7482_010479 [Penicillium canariense]